MIKGISLTKITSTERKIFAWKTLCGASVGNSKVIWL